MYYVLTTDLVRVPSPTLDAQKQYLFGLSITGNMAEGQPATAPSTTPPPPPGADPDLSQRIKNLITAAGTPLGFTRAMGVELGPIAPWTWTNFDEVSVTDGTAAIQVPVIAGPDLDDASFGPLLAAISNHLTFNNNGFLVDNPPGYMPFRGRPATQLASLPIAIDWETFSYESFVSSLAAAPAPLPHGQMNLVRFFILTQAQLQNFPNSGNADWEFAAIPVFTAEAAPGKAKTFAGAPPSPSPPSGTGTFFFVDPTQKVVQWWYNNTWDISDGTPEKKIIAYTQMRNLALIDSPDSFVNMKTLWVRPQHSNGSAGLEAANAARGLGSGGPSKDWLQRLPGALAGVFSSTLGMARVGGQSSSPGVLLDDWAQNLPSNLAKLFDLPRRFLDLFRGGDNLFVAVPLQDPTHLASYRLVHATLRALYDVLAPGVWGSTFDPTTKTWTGRTGLARSAAMAAYSSGGNNPYTPSNQVIDGVLGKLETQDLAIRSDFASLTEDWVYNSPNVFCQVVAARIGGLIGLPTRAADFLSALFTAVGALPNPLPSGKPGAPPVDATSTNVEILDRLVTLATSPDNAANIFADLWTQALTNLPPPKSYLDIRTVAVQLRVPEPQRRQIASFALAQGGILNLGPSSSADTELLKVNTLISLFGYLLGTLTFVPNPAPAKGTPEDVFSSQGMRAPCLDRNQIAALTAAPVPLPAPLPPLPLPPLLFSPAAEQIWNEISRWLPSVPDSPPQFGSYDFVPAQKPTTTAGGLSFQVDRVVQGNDGSSGNGSQNDFNTFLAGYGFWMRRALRSLNPAQDPGNRDNWQLIKEGQWHLLNAVQGAAGSWPLDANGFPKPPEAVSLRFHSALIPPPPPLPPIPPLVLELLAPKPIASSGGMPRVTFQYNNASPVGNAGTSDVTHTQSPEMNDAAPNIFHLIQPTKQDNPPPRELLPFLAYGLSYDLIVFAITNHGAVPEQLRSGVFPAVVIPDVDVEVALTDVLPESFKALVRSARYLRTTSVGHLGLDTDLVNIPNGSKAGGYDPFQIPKDVSLLAAEIPGLLRPIAVPDPSNVSPVDGRKACLLLADQHGNPVSGPAQPAGSREFQISAPACSLEVLDRWLARDEFYPAAGVLSDTIHQLRRTVRSLYSTANQTQQNDYNTPNPTHGPDDAKLEDPAVCGLVVTTQLYRRGGQEVDGPIYRSYYPWPSIFDQFTQTTPPPQLPQNLKALWRSNATVTLQIADQPLYPANAFTGLTRSLVSGVYQATASTTAAHGIAVGDQFTVSGCAPTAYNGTWTAVAGTAGSTITWSLGTAADPGAATTLGQLDAEARVGLSPASGSVPSITLTVNAGDVVLVTFHAAVKEETFEIDLGATTTRFDPIVLRNPAALDVWPPDPTQRWSIVDSNGTKYMLFDPLQIVVEAAQPNLPDTEPLYAACSLQVIPGDDQRQIVLDWTPGTAPSPQQQVAWDAVGAIETGDVAWAFTGRPVRRYPFELADFPDTIPGSSDTPATNPLLWEVETFADRATLAPAVKVFPVPLAQPGGVQQIPIQTLGPTGPAGVRRYEIAARNRYAAAYQQVPAAVTASRYVTHSQTTPPWVNTYRRLVVEAVPPDTVPEPSLRALIPLTRRMDDSDGPAVAGLLVVLNGAFGDVGGIAEWLDAAVSTIESEKLGLSRAQTGADPVIRRGPRGDDQTGTPLPPLQGYEFMPLQVFGPLGHTFDTAATVGLFNATSFVIEPPQITAADPGAWWMAELKLRRTILAEGVAQSTPISISPGAAKITLPYTAAGARPDGYARQWSFNLSGLALSVQAAIQTITVSALRISDGVQLPGGQQQLYLCWAKADNLSVAIWLAPAGAVPTAIPNEAWRVPNPQGASSVKVGLRLCFVPTMRRIQTWDSTGTVMTPQIVLTYNVSLQVLNSLLDASGASVTRMDWVFAGDFDWWTDSNSNLPDGTYDEKLQITVSWTASGLLQNAQETFVCVAPQASDWVENHWGQFLPDADRLGTVSLKNDVTVAVEDDSSVQIAGAAWWLNTADLASSGKRAAQKSGQGLFHLVMLSRSVRSASGRDSEAYQGLYWDNGQPTSSSGVVALQSFGTQPSDAQLLDSAKAGTLRWRLLTARTGTPNTDIKKALNNTTSNNPWQLFFPDERDDGVTVNPSQPSDTTMMPRDALLQIIEISGWHGVTYQ
jgi:hypothetical protein